MNPEITGPWDIGFSRDFTFYGTLFLFFPSPFPPDPGSRLAPRLMVLLRQFVQAQGNSQHRGVRRGGNSHFNQDSGSTSHRLRIFSNGPFTSPSAGAAGPRSILPFSLLPLLLRHKSRWNTLPATTATATPPPSLASLPPYHPISTPFLSDLLRFRFLLPCSHKSYKVPSKFYHSIDEVVGKLPPEDNQFPFASCHSVYYLHGLYPPFNTFPLGTFRLDTNMATTRAQFEEVFTSVVVPELIAEVKKTQISENAVQWIERVCYTPPPPLFLFMPRSTVLSISPFLLLIN